MQEFFTTSLSHTLHFDFEEMQYFYLKRNQKQAYEALKKKKNYIYHPSKLYIDRFQTLTHLKREHL